jgi:DNA protecting protein DprA
LVRGGSTSGRRFDLRELSEIESPPVIYHFLRLFLSDFDHMCEKIVDMDPEILDTISIIRKEQYPYLLQRITALPAQMDMIGTLPPETHRYLCVVGSRKYSDYGKEACEHVIAGLAGYPVVIVSGLAIGIDSIAHESALKAGLKTVAFPGSGLSKTVLYPYSRLHLARRIVEAGGALLSPFKRGQEGAFWTFPTRNKLMAGMCHATLIIEATAQSGTLLTAADTAEFGRDLLVVPGSIFSPSSIGSNALLRDGGTAVNCAEDVLEALGLQSIRNIPSIIRENDSTQSGTVTGTSSHSFPVTKNNKSGTAASTGDSTTYTNNLLSFCSTLSPDEKKLLEKMVKPIERDELIRTLDLPAGYVNALLIELELKGVVSERGGLLTVLSPVSSHPTQE